MTTRKATDGRGRTKRNWKKTQNPKTARGSSWQVGELSFRQGKKQSARQQATAKRFAAKGVEALGGQVVVGGTSSGSRGGIWDDTWRVVVNVA